MPTVRWDAGVLGPRGGGIGLIVPKSRVDELMTGAGSAQKEQVGLQPAADTKVMPARTCGREGWRAGKRRLALDSWARWCRARGREGVSRGEMGAGASMETCRSGRAGSLPGGGGSRDCGICGLSGSMKGTLVGVGRVPGVQTV